MHYISDIEAVYPVVVVFDSKDTSSIDFKSFRLHDVFYFFFVTEGYSKLLPLAFRIEQAVISIFVVVKRLKLAYLLSQFFKRFVNIVVLVTFEHFNPLLYVNGGVNSLSVRISRVVLLFVF